MVYCELWLERDRYLVYLIIKNEPQKKGLEGMLKNIVKESPGVNVRGDKELNGNTV